jgi:hypothetical protein
MTLIKVIPWIKQADIVIPEVGAHDQHIVEGLRLVAATKEAKADFTVEQIAKAKWTEQSIISPYCRTIIGKLRNSGKEVALIDVGSSHPVTELATRHDGTALLFGSILSKANKLPLADAVERIQPELEEVTSMLRDRELHIRSNLFNLLLDVTNRHLEERQNVLVILGSAHKVTADWFLERGIESTRNAEFSKREQRKLDCVGLMGQKAIAGVAITKEDVADAIVAGLFTQASKAYSKEIKSQLQKGEIASILYARLNQLFSYEDKEKLWNAPDTELGDVFEQIFLSKGVSPQDIVDRQT